MGFGYVALKMPECMSITFLMKQLNRFKLLIIMAINHLGLLKPAPEQARSHHSHPETPTSHLILTDGPNPSMVIVSAQALTSLIKKKLPVMEYGCFLEKFGASEEVKHTDHDHSACAVCLDSIDKNQEIRELSNCCHVFHRECLDKWVDESQITCPLCRSMLISVEGERNLCTIANS